jgi:hypothetical protein
MNKFDPDNPESQTVEELSRGEAETQLLEEMDDGDVVDAEENFTGESIETDEGLLRRTNMDEDVIYDEEQQNPFEEGTARGKVYDQILDEIESVTGYDGDAEEVDLFGDLIGEEVNEGSVRIVYELSENPVDTSSSPISFPGLQSADNETIQVAYQRDDVEVEIESTDQGYQVEFEYEDPDSMEEAARKVGVAVAELEEEFLTAYNIKE